MIDYLLIALAVAGTVAIFAVSLFSNSPKVKRYKNGLMHLSAALFGLTISALLLGGSRPSSDGELLSLQQ